MRLHVDDGHLSGGPPIYSSTRLAMIVSLVLGFLAIGAPVHAQDPAGIPAPAFAGDGVEALRPADLPGFEFRVIGDPHEFTVPVKLDTTSGGLDAEPSRSLLFSESGINQINWTDVFPDTMSAPSLRGLATQQASAPPQTPAHTGFKALVFETASDFNAFPRRTSTWVILAIGGGAAAIAHPFDERVTARFVESNAAGNFFVAGKYIGAAYVQVGVAAGLYVVGRYALPHADGASKSNKISHLGFDLLRALAVSQAFTQGIKIAVQRDRPTGECCSFPSGHASTAFATASVLERHLGYRGAWPTFAVATYVAMSRLHDNRHFLSDVLFGGALGVASGWTVVGRHGRSNYALLPVPVPGGFMVSFSRNPSPRPSS